MPWNLPDPCSIPENKDQAAAFLAPKNESIHGPRCPLKLSPAAAAAAGAIQLGSTVHRATTQIQKPK